MFFSFLYRMQWKFVQHSRSSYISKTPLKQILLLLLTFSCLSYLHCDPYMCTPNATFSQESQLHPLHKGITGSGSHLHSAKDLDSSVIKLVSVIRDLVVHVDMALNFNYDASAICTTFLRGNFSIHKTNFFIIMLSFNILFPCRRKTWACIRCVQLC